MQKNFLDFIALNKLVSEHGKILLGVSGGIDSMVMVDLFKKSEFNFAIAHCNFDLREKESEDDEKFVRKYAAENKLPFFSKKFKTGEFASAKGLSIQMAARKLRMNWMQEIADQERFCCIAMAHHQDDQVETFFLNLMRGTGIAGLHGILPKSGRIIHPMLFTDRNGIVQYANKNDIRFREDSSNLKNDYLRNKIRHKVLPELEKITPGFARKLSGDIAHFRSVEKIYRSHLSVLWNSIAEEDEHGASINLAKLRKLQELPTYLFEFLNPFGFNAADAEQIAASIERQAGKQFISKTHRVVVDRSDLIIGKRTDPDVAGDRYSIVSGNTLIEHPVRLKLSISKKESGFQIISDPSIALLDSDKVKFPLELRRWKKGDFFYPLGMSGKKLLSDFFTDQKFSLFDKESCWIITTGDQIIWIAGSRIDDRFKITEGTTTLLTIEYGPLHD